MKGIIFCEFLDMVEGLYGYETVDAIITESNLPNNGAYTSIGTYDHQELFRLAENLGKHCNLEIGKLLNLFGQKVFKTFVKSYPEMFVDILDGYSFLSKIENNIHVEVLKLYPEAELPKIKVQQTGTDQMVLTYNSVRKMSDFAEGLIRGCMLYFNETIVIQRKNKSENGSIVEFVITKK